MHQTSTKHWQADARPGQGAKIIRPGSDVLVEAEDGRRKSKMTWGAIAARRRANDSTVRLHL